MFILLNLIITLTCCSRLCQREARPRGHEPHTIIPPHHYTPSHAHPPATSHLLSAALYTQLLQQQQHSDALFSHAGGTCIPSPSLLLSSPSPAAASYTSLYHQRTLHTIICVYGAMLAYQNYLLDSPSTKRGRKAPRNPQHTLWRTGNEAGGVHSPSHLPAG